MKALNAFVVGLVFAFGLVLSGMTQPKKVIGFLDFFGEWDPTLAFVMGGAATTYAFLFAWMRRKREKPLLSDAFALPSSRDLDVPLIAGSAVFGVGWGLAGFCPGPALVAAGGGVEEGVWFTVAMLIGMAGARLILRRRQSTV